MAHLGDDVAAFVDGQLSPASTRAAEAHLEDCATCRQAVVQQRQLKSRMRTVGTPEPPADLLASLSTLPQAPPAPPRHSWWSVMGVGLVLLGASMAVVAVAYVIGPEGSAADSIEPQFERLAADFTASTSRRVGSLSDEAMDELDAYGWPCRKNLGGLDRVAGQYRNGQETVALVYADDTDVLNLYEQSGALDRQAVRGFERRELADHRVWVREGHPRIVTWDADGVVYTITTEMDDARLSPVVADLPRPAAEPDPAERVGDGLSRMTTWLSDAA